MDVARIFEEEKKKNIAKMNKNKKLISAAKQFLIESVKEKYSYNFTWLGRPIIQYPQDIVLIQELIWQIKPDLIIETGIAHGGSLILSASLLELIGGPGKVIGVDIEIRKHNRKAIENHPLYKRITMFEGSSTDPKIVACVKKAAQKKKKVMVFLDSLHTHEYVLGELELYSPLVTKGSYLVVFDTVIEELPVSCYSDRPWSPGNNPETAVHAFLKQNHNFMLDKTITKKLLMTVARNGFLKRIR